jgi:hypothetical protein
MNTKSAKKPWLKRLLLAGLVLLVAGAALVYYLFSLKFDDTAGTEAHFEVDAKAILTEFAANDSAANKKYTEKIVVVRGRVSEVEPVDTTVNLKFVDTTNGNYVIFSFQAQHVASARQVKPGDSLAIKGSCSGGSFSSILGSTYVAFKRCAIDKKL